MGPPPHCYVFVFMFVLGLDRDAARPARLLAHPPPPGAATRWLAWRRRHQALSTWYHHRTRLARDELILLVR